MDEENESKRETINRLRPERQFSHRSLEPEESKNRSEKVEEPQEQGLLVRSSRAIILVGVGGLLFILTVFWAVIHFSSSEPDPGSEVVQIQSNFVERSDPGEVEESIDLAVRGFMSAGSLVERAGFVMGGETVLPKMRDYYGRGGESLPQGCQEVADQISTVSGGGFLMGARGIDLDGRSFWFSLVSGQNRVLIDWESTVGYGEMKWSDFVDKRPSKEVLMRVYLLRFINEEEAGQPNPSFFYRISDKSQKSSVIAAPVRGGRVEADLAALVPPRERHPITIRVRFYEGRAFAEITEVVHDLWVDTDRSHEVKTGD